MVTLKVADILAESVVDGLGIRTVVFFQGCPRHCPGCHNAPLISFEGGTEYYPEELAELILAKMTPIHRGITFSGGDPLAQADGLLDLVYLLRKAKPALNIWLYTGYLFEDVKELPVVKAVNVMVDGPFILEQRDISLPFKGSSNQRVIDISATIQNNEVIELKL